MCIFVAFIVVNRRLLFFSRLLFRPARDLFQVTVLTEMKGLWSLVLCHLQVWIEGWNSLCYFCICCLGSLGGTRCELDIRKICRVYVVVLPSTHYLPRGNWTHVEYIMLLCSPDNSILDNIKQIHQQRRGCWTKMTFWSFYALLGHFDPC